MSFSRIIKPLGTLVIFAAIGWFVWGYFDDRGKIDAVEKAHALKLEAERVDWRKRLSGVAETDPRVRAAMGAVRKRYGELSSEDDLRFGSTDLLESGDGWLAITLASNFVRGGRGGDEWKDTQWISEIVTGKPPQPFAVECYFLRGWYPANSRSNRPRRRKEAQKRGRTLHFLIRA